MEITKITIMMMLFEGRPSIPEMSERVNKAFATVHKDLQELVRKGLVKPPRFKGAARDYYVTPKGREYLRVNGYIKEEKA